jgi:hypothetical protein
MQLLLCLASAVTFEPKFHRTYVHILLSHLRLPQPGGPGHHIYIPEALDSLFITSYDLQGYGGGIQLVTGSVNFFDMSVNVAYGQRQKLLIGVFLFPKLFVLFYETWWY